MAIPLRPTRSRPLAAERRWWLALASLLAILMLGVMAAAAVGSAIQTGVRAYVGGEGLWSKAEKDAVIDLQRFSETHDEADWEEYRVEIAVTLGDRQARLELERPTPDDAAVFAGFTAGRNAPEDVPSLAMLFRTFRHLSFIDRAIAIWTEADAEIDGLQALAGRIRVAVVANDDAALTRLRRDLDGSNDRLTRLESDFSQTLGDGARWVQAVLLIVMAAILGLLVAITATVGRSILNHLRAADIQAAETLRASEARLRLLVDHLPAIAWTTDVDLLVTSMTGEGLACLGLAEDAFTGRAVTGQFDPQVEVEREGRVALASAHREALLGHSGSYRVMVSERTSQAHVQPVRVDGRIVGVVGLALDLTDRLELEARLERSTRLESIGRLAGGVAHDFNNFLTAITGYADLLTTSLPEGDQRHDAEEILRAARRASDLTSQLLAFGRRQVLKSEIVSPNDVIMDMRNMIERLIGDDIVLELDLDPRLPDVLADQGQLEQVVLNLTVNARDAMPAGGRLTIATSRTTMDPSAVDGARGPGAATTDAVAIRVQDTGVGMNEATRSRIFEPFFTTKGRGKGTGLGLSTVYGIVEQSGGAIRVESTPGSGSAFTVVMAAAVGSVSALRDAATGRRASD
ncbi:MAG: PAS domain S-box protein, partial [Chloroflexi bacterium]|nr:PAS domain S-box protein [Chloroflexota bacterium]